MFNGILITGLDGRTFLQMNTKVIKIGCIVTGEIKMVERG
jgi:hypothetical protein